MLNASVASAADTVEGQLMVVDAVAKSLDTCDNDFSLVSFM